MNVKNSIHIAEEVVASVASLAACEVDGVSSLMSAGGAQISDRRGKRAPTKGVKIQITDDTAVIDVILLVKYGYNVRTVAEKVQENIKQTLESMTGMTVIAVNVRVGGISLKKETKKKSK
ncbi:MAG: Asp23/Gls24 family envelope stress response protein [Oscillospiraceae bacterium]|nr:Asp23/Gls24 family envelope stress response protein [Oscillospiraceae bacterium]